MVKLLLLVSFLSLNISYSQTYIHKPHSTDSTKTLFIKFIASSLEFHQEGKEKIDFICDTLLKTANSLPPNFIITLIPYYCIAEIEQNKFIGVSRAKLVLDELINCDENLKNHILIKDSGTADFLISLCSGNYMPLLSLDRFQPSVIVIFEEVK